MTARCQRPFDVYLDEDCIRPDGPLESPINLKTHYHDELVARSQGELEEFQKIESEYPDQNNVQPEKQISLRAWYEKAYTRKLKAFPNGVDPVKPLVMEDLQDEIKKYAEVTFFGGASLTVLHRILDADDTLPEGEEKLGKKINYYQQGVSSPLPIILQKFGDTNTYNCRALLIRLKTFLGILTILP